MAESLSIGEVAERVGIRPSAVRYYERRGLLAPMERVGGKRRYGAEAVDLLLLIRFCQQVGFSLSEVRSLLTRPTAKQAKQTWRELVDGKLSQVDALIAQAQAVKEVLQASRGCDCVTLEGCAFVKTAAQPAAAQG